MGTYQSVTTTGPYGSSVEVLQINSDGETYVLRDVIGRAGDYTFSVWHKGEGASASVFGHLEYIPPSEDWEKSVVTVSIADLTDNSIMIQPDSNADLFLFEGYCTEGTVDTSWSPNPDDQKSINEMVAENATEITDLNKRADAISEDLDSLNKAVELYEAYFEINPNVPSIILGKINDDSSFKSKVVITSTAVEFHVDDKPLAYASGQTFNAPEGVFESIAMKKENEVGDLRWIARSNGHLSLKVVK